MKIQPDIAFEVLRADEVAECWEGVNDHLYKKLWDIVQMMPRYNPEVMEEPVIGGKYALAYYWKYLDEDEQRQLNELAEKN